MGVVGGGFQLPEALDLGAIFLFALTGALAAIRKRYDWVGLLSLAIVTGIGGGLVRDGILISSGPPALIRDSRFLTAAVLGGLVGLFAGARLDRFRPFFDLSDALALGIYTVVGIQKGTAAGLGAVGALLTGVVSAVGGGLLRDLVSREEPRLFRPGHFYAAACIAGGAGYLGVLRLGLPASPAAYATIVLIFGLRTASVGFDWKTRAVADEAPPPSP